MKILTFTVEAATGKKYISNATKDEFRALTTPVYCDRTIVGTISRLTMQFWVPPISAYTKSEFDLVAEMDENVLIQRVHIQWTEKTADSKV